MGKLVQESEGISEETAGSFLRDVDGTLMQERINSFNGIIEGFTLGARFDLRSFFYDKRLQMMQAILFTSDELSSEMAISNLKGKVFTDYAEPHAESFNAAQAKFL